MNCGQTRELIQLYLDSELDIRSTLEVEGHLRACPLCRWIIESLWKQDCLLKEAALRETIETKELRARILGLTRRYVLEPSTGSGGMRQDGFSVRRVLVGLWLRKFRKSGQGRLRTRTMEILK